MGATPVGRKVSALLYLAGGGSNRVAAEAAEVSPSTVAVWRRDPVFAAELEAVRAVYEREPRDAAALLARLDEAEQRLSSPGPVSLPAGVSAGQLRKLVARGVVRAVERGLR